MRMSDAIHAAELPVYKRWDLDVVEGEGTRIRTRDGREFVDFYGGHATALFGYRHPRLLTALQHQAEELHFQTNAVDVPIRREAIAALGSIAPQGVDQVFLVNSGAEANENALRLAFRATKRQRVVAMVGAFHGRTAAAGACTWGAEQKWYGFPRTPFGVTFVTPGDVEALEKAVDGDTAAVILEAIQGVAGARPLSRDYIRAARRITASKGALLIADEIQCGMGRSGVPFAIASSGIVPDMITVAKGLAGGFPAGALLARRSLAATLGLGDLGTTFGGGPMACALIVEVIRLLSQPGMLDSVSQISSVIQERCQVGPVTGVQGRGLLLGLRTGCPAVEVLDALREKGVLAGGAADPHVVRLLPPLTISEGEVEILGTALEEIAT